MDIVEFAKMRKTFGGGGGSADWNANAGEDGYIKNRTHYTTVKKVEILPETTRYLYGPDAQAEDVFTMNAFPPENTEIKVVFDGVEYSVKTVAVDELLGFGDVSKMGVPFTADVPFYGVLAESLLMMIYDVNNGGGTHTFSIYYEEEVTHKIDTKYFPEGIGCEEVKEEWTPIFESVDATYTYNELGREDYKHEYECEFYVGQFVTGDKYKVVVDGIEFEGEALDSASLPFPNGARCVLSGDYCIIRSDHEITTKNPCPISLYHCVERAIVHKMDSKYLPDVADLDAQWLADLKVALNK